ncbi:MAG: DUF805 domain-containing protein [Coraliomargaritaceae bacterium]|jgi:uncharacterized membrane protein YhaH (DUF805 family)
MKEQIFSSLGTIGPINYFIRILLFVAIPFIVTVFSVNFFSHWHHGTHLPLGIFIGLIFTLFSIFVILMQTIKRLNDIGKPPIYSLLLLIPLINILFILVLLCLPRKQ